jgi:CRISPR-associated endonuclease/helicase Cas3
MAYYARSYADQPESAWEPLARHLTDVGRLAGERGSRFGAGSLAEAAGKLHDLGKYSTDFLARLRCAPISVDHSTAGAVWALDNLSPICGRIIAHAIAGHHTGLVDRLLAPDGRIARKRALLIPAERAALADGLSLPAAVTRPAGMGKGGSELAQLTRMVFSCLLDADRTVAAGNSEAFEHPSIPLLSGQLQAWFASQNHPPTPLNRLRADVLRTATERAGDPQGVFTLTVPTGGGKTLTSLAFALAHALVHGLDRVIVVIPYTSIIEQTAEVYRTALGPLAGAVLEHHSGFEPPSEDTFQIRTAMERWDSPIVVTTAVQFFESLFSNRPSRCRKLHQIARSVVVVDEAQTMPLPLLRPCIAALKDLTRSYGTSVVLCTATQPALTASTVPGQGFVGGFIEPREIASVPGLFAALRRVTVREIGVQTDAQLAERIATSTQVLCVVNQRRHAQALYRTIAGQDGARHLSTLMHSVHRSRVLAEIRADLAAGRPCRVISTSLIEAGVDVDFPLVLRAEAGLDQIAQAAGRCNREGRLSAADSQVLIFRAAKYPVIRSLMPNAQAGAEMLRLHAADPLGPDAIRAYFQQLYWRIGRADLDQGGVLRMCQERAGDLDFSFQSIADAMRFIDDREMPVIVPFEDGGAVAPLIGALQAGPERINGIARRLGRYTVGVPEAERAKMIAAGDAEVIRQDLYDHQFVVLTAATRYDREIGLAAG